MRRNHGAGISYKHTRCAQHRWRCDDRIRAAGACRIVEGKQRRWSRRLRPRRVHRRHPRRSFRRGGRSGGNLFRQAEARQGLGRGRVPADQAPPIPGGLTPVGRTAGCRTGRRRASGARTRPGDRPCRLPRRSVRRHGRQAARRREARQVARRRREDRRDVSEARSEAHSAASCLLPGGPAASDTAVGGAHSGQRLR